MAKALFAAVTILAEKVIPAGFLVAKAKPNKAEPIKIKIICLVAIKKKPMVAIAQAKVKVKNNKKWNDVKTSIDSTDWEEDEKRRHLIAARYLSSLDKGENALELCLALEENFELEAGNEYKKIFNVPPYIHNALEWLLR